MFKTISQIIPAVVLMSHILCANAAEPRRVISLDGTWQIAQGKLDVVPSGPSEFVREVPVPGLVDMAKPGFDEIGLKSEKREAFWYRRTLSFDGTLPETAILKIHKAKFGARVFLNGKLVGEHLPCFTPAEFNIRQHVLAQGQTNELLIRIGASRESLPETMPRGWDFEKLRYIPGIYDSIQLILTGTPHIVCVQTVPDISAQNLRIVTWVNQQAGSDAAKLRYTIREARSQKIVATSSDKHQKPPLTPGETEALISPVMNSKGEQIYDVTIPMKDCRLWSPEDPFLYELTVSSGGDSLSTRFGMRSFKFDKASGRAVLNGKPYFLRGTNICLYRFFED